MRRKKMKKIFTFMVIIMFFVVGLGAFAMGEPEGPVKPNRAPEAPIIIEYKSRIEKQKYEFFFYSIDPDGDDVYYSIWWNKVNKKVASTIEPDVPVVSWFGPYSSGEEIDKERTCKEYGNYELTICAKDTHGKIGPSTTITVTNTKPKVLQYPVFVWIIAKFSSILYQLTKILNL